MGVFCGDLFCVNRRSLDLFVKYQKVIFKLGRYLEILQHHLDI